MGKKAPLFILGAPRSGTTFLASLLTDTKFGSPFETHFITKYFRKLSEYGDINQFQGFDLLIRDILGERPVMQWNLQLDIRDFYESLVPSFDYAEIVNQLCLLHAAQMGNSNWGDKTPHYVGELDTIYQLFPDSKYLFIVRDGRDVALSLLEKSWGPNNIYYCAKYWKMLNSKQSYLNELEAKDQLKVVQYEYLLDNFEVETKNIYEFLGIEFDPLDQGAELPKVKKGNYGKWEKSLSVNQIKVFENIAASMLNTYGYQTSNEEKPISFFWRLGYFAHHYVLLFRHLFTINVIDGFKIRFLGKEPFSE